MIQPEVRLGPLKAELEENHPAEGADKERGEHATAERAMLSSMRL